MKAQAYQTDTRTLHTHTLHTHTIHTQYTQSQFGNKIVAAFVQLEGRRRGERAKRQRIVAQIAKACALKRRLGMA